MSTDDIDLLYKFRYSLTENKRALVKFLHAVNWEEVSDGPYCDTHHTNSTKSTKSTKSYTNDTY
jgi:hypothetical protein